MTLDESSFPIFVGSDPSEFVIQLDEVTYESGTITAEVSGERIFGGPADSTGDWTMYVDGVEQDSVSDGGPWNSVSHTLTGEGDPNATVEVEYDNDPEGVSRTLEHTLDVEVFDIDDVTLDCSVESEEVVVGEEVVIGATVTNENPDGGQVEVTFTFGDAEASESIELDAGASGTAEATFVPESVGDYTPSVSVSL